MANDKLLIPPRLNVGFKNDEDTYTGKKAYVIYYDVTGKLRKEESWQGWRDKKIPNVEFDNVPTEGFVLNKGVGGVRESHGYNVRNEYVRVYDQRGWEIEITVPNLLFILNECDCYKGKGLAGKYVYAWNRSSLVLLPCDSQEYKQCQEFTNVQGKGVKPKELKPGYTYLTKQMEEHTYIGKMNWYYSISRGFYGDNVNDPGVKNGYIFWTGKEYIRRSSVNNLAHLKSDEEHPKFAKLMDKYLKGPNGGKYTKLELRPTKGLNQDLHMITWWTLKDDMTAYRWSQSRNRTLGSIAFDINAQIGTRHSYRNEIEYHHAYRIIDGMLINDYQSEPSRSGWNDIKKANGTEETKNEHGVPVTGPRSMELYIVNEHGGVHKWDSDFRDK